MGTVSCWIVPSKVNRARVNVHVARTNVVGDNTAMLSITFCSDMPSPCPEGYAGDDCDICDHGYMRW